MITLDVVTPDRKIIDGAQVKSVTVPSVEGEMTIMPGHAELMALLGIGLLEFQVDGGVRRFAVSEGFLEVRGDKVAILAETCEEPAHIDVGRAAVDQKEAEAKLAGGNTLSEKDFDVERANLERAIVRQQIARG